MSDMSKKEIKWIAITGVIGSGKSSVIDYLKRCGYEVLDCDEIAHECLKVNEPSYFKVIDIFGKELIKDDLSINRSLLANLIFNNDVAKTQLEAILHPDIKRRLYLAKQASTSSVLFVEVPLLYECGWDDDFDAVWVVSSNLDTIYARCMNKRLMSVKEVEERLSKQIPLKIKESKADVLLMNNQGIEHLYQQIDEVIERGLL